MGLIAQRWAEDEQRITLADFMNDDLDAGQSTPSGIRVNRQAALSLTTIWRCIDVLTSTVSQAPIDIVLKMGGTSFQQFQKPEWVSTPDPGDPNYTINDYFEEVTMSLLLEGNFFVDVYPDIREPVRLRVVDPRKVRVESGATYIILDDAGQQVGRRNGGTMLHGWWKRLPGTLRGISPLEQLRRSIGGAIAAEEHASRFFGQGASMSFGVEVPGGLNAEQRSEMRESMRRQYAGITNSHAIGVLTNGAKFITGLTPTPEQAQMLATRQFSVEDLCRPFGVPPQLAGSQQPGSSSYASAEVYNEQFKSHGVGPLARRIEIKHERLLSLPSGIADVNATMQFRFNLDWLLRMNLQARYTAYNAGVLGGFLKPREARAEEDLPPLADNSDDQLFMQQQMVPLAKLGATAAPPIPQGGDNAA